MVARREDQLGSKYSMETQPTTRKARMTKYLAVEACIALVLLTICPRVSAQSVRTGSDAYGDWRTDAPGVMRRITPADLPAPGETPSTANRSKVVPKPANATLKTMPGFSVDALVTGMQGARVLRVAPNGDIFLALSRPEGKIVTIRTGTDMSNPKVETFATGLQDAYGIAFYPPGPDPKWLYVGELGKLCAFPIETATSQPPVRPRRSCRTSLPAATIGPETSPFRPMAKPCTSPSVRRATSPSKWARGRLLLQHSRKPIPRVRHGTERNGAPMSSPMIQTGRTNRSLPLVSGTAPG